MTADTCAIIGTVDKTATRRNDRNAVKKAAILDALREGASTAEAAEAAGIGRTTAWRWRQEDEAFAVAWHDAEEHGTDRLETVARRRAIDGSDTLIIFLLKARRPEKYRDNMKIEHTVNGPTDEQLARARRAGMDAALEERAAEFLGMLEGTA